MSRSVVLAVSPQAATVGYSRAVRDGRHVHVSGTAPINPDDGDRPRTRTCRRSAASRSSSTRSSRPARAWSTSSGRASTSRDAADWEAVGRAHGEVFATSGPATTGVVAALLDPRWLVEIEAEARRPVKQIYPASITGKGAASPRAAACSTTVRQSDPYTLGVEEEYMLLDAETFDLVQHIDTVLAAVSGHELEPRINPELMQSVLEVATPVCHTPADVARAAADAARVRRARSRASAACASARPGRTRSASSSGSGSRRGPLPGDGRPDAVHRAARAHLRHARARRRRRRGEGDPDRERADRASRGARRAVGELAVLARRADRARVVAAHGLRGAAALGPAAALPQLRGLRRGRRPARAHRVHRRLHAHLVGHPAAPAARHDRDPDLRRRHAARGRDRADRVLPGARQALRRAVRRGRGDAVVPPHPHDREQVARRALRHRGAA